MSSEYTCSHCGILFRRSYGLRRWKTVFCGRVCQKAFTITKREARRAQVILAGIKTCSQCTALKPLEEFYIEPRRGDGFSVCCKACHNANNKIVVANRKILKPGHDRLVSLRGMLRRKYGLDIIDYRLMAEVQEGRCAICGGEGSRQTRKHRLYVDHCHKTGSIRGLLCHPCNVALGLLQEDTRVLRNALAYLEKHSASASCNNTLEEASA